VRDLWATGVQALSFPRSAQAGGTRRRNRVPILSMQYMLQDHQIQIQLHQASQISAQYHLYLGRAGQILTPEPELLGQVQIILPIS